MPAKRHPIGGVIHTYQRYDPRQFPNPTDPPPDAVSPAFEHMMTFGTRRKLTPEQLARAIRIDPSQIAGLGPSLDALLAMLRERKRKILATYQVDSTQADAARQFRQHADRVKPPRKQRARFELAVQEEQLYELERLWYASGDDASPYARELVQLMESLGDKYQIDELAAKYTFTGHTPLSITDALAIKEELAKIDELIKQLLEARETAQIAVIDLDALSEFTEEMDVGNLRDLQKRVEEYIKQLAELQGLELESGELRLTPQAYRLFQNKLLEKIFSHLQEARTGRHQGPIVGEGAVELQRTKPYEFGDSLTHLDIPQSFVNALIRQGGDGPIRLRGEDLVVHHTRNTPQCATCVVMDMSGSMRHGGQYLNVKRMALALDGLIRREYPGDFLQFVEMYTFARLRRSSEIIELLPKPVTLFDPIVRYRIDMSRPEVSEHQVPPHFTNLQHALQLSRRCLVRQETPNRQIILITDGLPTAHFEGEWLYLLYPPDPQTEASTLREGLLCQRDGITINIFLVPSWSQSEEDIRFAYRLAESTKGRVFFTAGNDLDRYVVWDYVSRKREIVT
jgi:uncharacterized protein with von Willebrand factor type A (vWA) domain